MDAGTGQVRGGIVEKLSPRQREIMEMVAKGLTERQIARELGIAARTVKYHKATARSRSIRASRASMSRARRSTFNAC